MEIARSGNKYLQDTEPWKLVKDEANSQVVADCLFTCINVVKEIGNYAQIFLPETANKILGLLNLTSYQEEIQVGHKLNKPSLLFEKIEDELIAIQMEKLQKPNAEEVISVAEEKTVAAVKSEIVYDDFAKLDIRVATIIAAEKVKKADRLLHITLDLGLERRSVVSGIAAHFSPEDIVGQQVTYLANLAPRTLKGIESSGMILMAEDADGKLKFVSPADNTAPGSIIA
jgi:methionyl-tRNA synthetase